MMGSLGREVGRLGVQRQSVIKMWLAERLKEAPFASVAGFACITAGFCIRTNFRLACGKPGYRV